MAFHRPLIWRRILSGCSRISTATAAASDKFLEPSKIKKKNISFSSSCSSPWLMLPPSFKDYTRSIDYNFYSLAENRVLTPIEGGITADLMPNPIHDLRFCGSSHGWLALFNPQTFQLFLYDPISRSHINLPPTNKIKSVTKVILSSESKCRRAVMIYTSSNRLAFCCPGRSKEWTHIGKRHSYEDIVYSSRQKNILFAFNRQHDDLETWDLSDLSSPRMIKKIKYKNYVFDDTSPIDLMASLMRYLVVVADEVDQVLLVNRYYMWHVAPDGSYVGSHYCPSTTLYPHMTVDFSIRVYDQKKGTLAEEDQSSTGLGDLALFIGNGIDSVALSAARFPELKPNSIYFTDSRQYNYNPSWDDDGLFGGHDIGIFDFETRTVSPCYYPCDVRSLKRLVPSPMWFFPRRG